MLENNGVDKKQMINFGLFTLALMAFIIYFQTKQAKNQEQNPQAQKTEQTVKKPTENKIEAPKITDTAKIETIQLKNELLTVDFSTLGGQISQVQLNEYNAYSEDKNEKKPVLLFANNNAKYGFQFKDNSGKIISTQDLVFTPQVQGNKIALQAHVGAATIQFVYTLLENYNIDFHVSTNGMAQMISDNEARFVWNYKVRAMEKGRSQEEQHTEFGYAFNNYKDYDYDGRTDMKEPKEILNWIAIKQQFFTATIEAQNGFKNSFGHQDVIEEGEFLKDFNFDGGVQLSGKEMNQNFTWYFMPLDLNLLKSYQGKNFKEILPLGWSFIGGVNRVFFVPFFNWLSSYGIAAGWVIFLMTIAVKIILSPIMYRQYKLSAMMRVIRPEIEEVQKKFKDADAVKKQQETMAVYRKAGVNQFAGCLPGLLQAPLFYALFRFFPNMISLRGKGFWFVDDLTAYDDLIKLPNIPILGDHLSVFAIACTAAVLAYTLLSGNIQSQPTQPGMPNMKVMMYIFPIFFLFFLNSAASGLSWYYFVSNAINVILIFVIKFLILDEKKIHAQIQANKAKPKKEGKFQARMREMMEKAQEQQRQAENLKKQQQKRRK